MIKIPLTRNQTAIIDECDEHLKKFKWFCYATGYAGRHLKLKGKQYFILLHHAIMGKPLNGLQVDHINCDRLDNRRENLRIVTKRVNLANQKRRREGRTASQYAGVKIHIYKNKDKTYKYWESSINIDGKRKYLGTFKDEIDAANAYQDALKKL